MAGKNCVAIASDMRFGVQNQTMATDMKKVFKIHDHLYVGLAGLATDMMTLYGPARPFPNVMACCSAQARRRGREKGTLNTSTARAPQALVVPVQA